MKIKEKFILGMLTAMLMIWGVPVFAQEVEEAFADALGENSEGKESEAVNAADFTQEGIEAAVFEALGEKGSFTPFSPRTIPAFKVPSIESVETKALQLKFSDALWALSEEFSDKEDAKFIMDKINTFEPVQTRNVIRQAFREYLVKQNILDKTGKDGELSFSKGDSGTFKEDYIDDLKGEFSGREFGLAVAAAAHEKKIEKIASNLDKAVGKAEEKAAKAEKKAAKAEEKTAKADEKSGEKTDSAEGGEDKDKKDNNGKK